MRAYIFTKHERRVLMKFIQEKKRNDTVTQVMYFLEKDWPTLLADVRLLLRLKRLQNAGY